MSSPHQPTAADAAAELDARRFGRPADGWRRTLYTIIFESGTRGGKIFDVALLVAIGLSVTVVMLESVKPIRALSVTLTKPAPAGEAGLDQEQLWDFERVMGV